MTDSKEMVKTVYKALDSKKAEDITVIDISKISTLSDYFIITNGTSLPHVQTLVSEVESELSKAGYEVSAVEGGRAATWILLDYLDIVVHVFTKEDREFYNLERIWRDGRFVALKDMFNENE